MYVRRSSKICSFSRHSNGHVYESNQAAGWQPPQKAPAPKGTLKHQLGTEHPLTSPQETKALTAGKDHQGPGEPKFIPIRRHWKTTFKPDDIPFADATRQNQDSTVDAAPNAVMQRWKTEAVRNQPFHAIDAVALPDTRSAGQNQSASQLSGSSVGYLAD